MPDARDPGSHLPLSHLALHILLALGEAPSHGYAIGKYAEERTGGKLKPTTGGLYQALRRMGDDGLVARAEKVATESSDARRQYFQLTALGRQVLQAELGRLEAILTAAEASDLFPRSA